MNAVLIIPSRLASTRLNEKPLYKIADKPLILHVLERAKASFDGRIIVACCDKSIKDIVDANGGEAILTDPELPSGTDRVYNAYQKAGCTEEIIINLQGDMAVFPDNLIPLTLDVFNKIPNTDVATAICPIEEVIDSHEMMHLLTDPSSVKVAFDPISRNHSHSANPAPVYGRALYFSRTPIPYGAIHYYKHIGIYAYTTKSLNDFVKASVKPLEVTEKLEQLRGLSMGMHYGAVVANGDYYSIDTMDDVHKAELYFRRQLASGKFR